MDSGTTEKIVKVVLDTNIIISAIGFGGKPRQILHLALTRKIRAVSSPALLAELSEIISKKFSELEVKMPAIERRIKKSFIIIRPAKSLIILKDEADNRVLEAGVEGDCDFIVTGDKELLALKKYGKIKICSADEFLKIRKSPAY